MVYVQFIGKARLIDCALEVVGLIPTPGKDRVLLAISSICVDTNR